MLFMKIIEKCITSFIVLAFLLCLGCAHVKTTEQKVREETCKQASTMVEIVAKRSVNEADVVKKAVEKFHADCLAGILERQVQARGGDVCQALADGTFSSLLHAGAGSEDALSGGLLMFRACQAAIEAPAGNLQAVNSGRKTGQG